MKIKRLIICIFTVCVAILSFDAAVQAAEEQMSIQNGTMSGTVTNLEGDPLSGISVSLVRGLIKFKSLFRF